VKKSLAVEEKEVAALCRLGLTEYESRIYLALVKMGPRKASEVSFFGHVPRTKAYGAMRELEHKGLVQVIPGKPELYVPSPPSEFLMPLVSKLDNEVKESESVVQELGVLHESSKYIKREIPKETGELWKIEGRQNVVNKLNEILSEAKSSIRFITTASGLIRAYKAHSDSFERAKKQGALIRVLFPSSSENAALAREFSEIVELKRLDKPLKASLVSADGKELVVVESNPEDLKTDRGSDLAVWTKNKLLVELYDQLFDHFWNTTAKSRPGD
jgi:sugar-specific transcriptional regulator TrmB